ncbi:hypothetical protein BD779DRAFT_1675428 [Infundibulicybe gibba]|nr:hypothetical protein BD779DRAFT_1675428 [Infundibulicybe gibba]
MAFAQLDALVSEVVLECTFYGVYVVLFILYIVLWRRNKRFGGLLTLAQILLFGLCTLSLFFDIAANYLVAQAILGVPGDRVAALAKLGVGSSVLFTVVDSLAHVILLYRCWIIWDKRWAVVAIPGFLVLAALGIGFALARLSTPHTGSDSDSEAYVHICRSMGAARHSVSLVVNAFTTSLIMTKIFLTPRVVGSSPIFNSHWPLRVVPAMLIESGFLMFAYQLAFTVLFWIGDPAFNIMGGPIPQIYGIAPTLLSIRVAMGSAHNKTTVGTLSLRFSHPAGGAATPTTGLSTASAAGRQSRGINTEFGDDSNSEGAAGNAV